MAHGQSSDTPDFDGTDRVVLSGAVFSLLATCHVVDADGTTVGFIDNDGDGPVFVPGYRAAGWDAAALYDLGALLARLNRNAAAERDDVPGAVISLISPAVPDSARVRDAARGPGPDAAGVGAPAPDAPTADAVADAPPRPVQPETPGPASAGHADTTQTRVSVQAAAESAPWSPAHLARVASPENLQAIPPLHKRHDDGPRPDGVTVNGVDIIGRVVEIAEHHDHSLRSIAAAVRDPEQQWAGEPGTTCYLRGDVMAIVAHDTGEVIAIAARETALIRRQHIGGGIPRAKSGGPGNRVPHDVTSMLERVRAHGFDVQTDRRHYIVTHPDVPGAMETMSKSPSDFRTFDNMVAQVRASFGIDLRDPT